MLQEKIHVETDHDQKLSLCKQLGDHLTIVKEERTLQATRDKLACSHPCQYMTITTDGMNPLHLPQVPCQPKLFLAKNRIQLHVFGLINWPNRIEYTLNFEHWEPNSNYHISTAFVQSRNFLLILSSKLITVVCL